MWILDRYVAREILKTFAVAIGAFTILAVLAALYELLREGYPPELMLRVLPFAAAYTTPFLVPVSLAIACSLAYGRLVADNEVIPVLVGGVHPRALIWPGLLLGLVASILMYGVQASIIPYAYFQKKAVLKKILEDLVHLRDAENVRLVDYKDGFFIYARRSHAGVLEGVELVGFPGMLSGDGAGGGGALQGSGRLELTAERARIRPEPDRIEIEVEDAVVTYYQTKNLSPGSVDGDGDQRIDAREWREVLWALHRLPSPVSTLDRDGDHRLDPREAAPLLRRLGDDAPPFASFDEDGDGRLGLSEVRGLEQKLPPPGDLPPPPDLNRDGVCDTSELGFYLSGLDKTEIANEGYVQLKLARFTFEVAPESKTRYRMAFRTNKELVALIDQVERWRALIGAGPGALIAARLATLAAQAQMLGSPGLAPAVGLPIAGLAAVSPGHSEEGRALRLERTARATLHERAVLSCAPFLFAWVSVVLPLLLRSSHRLVPFFVAFATVSTTFFAPFLAAQGILGEEASLPPALLLWPAAGITLGVALFLSWRLFKR